MLNLLSMLTGIESSFLLSVLKFCGIGGILFVIWFLTRRSEDKRLTTIIKLEDKKWTQKFQQENDERARAFEAATEERNRQFKIFENLMEHSELQTGVLSSILANQNNHTRQFQDLGERLNNVFVGMSTIHGRLDKALLAFAEQRKDPE